jgi:hypothetical protein
MSILMWIDSSKMVREKSFANAVAILGTLARAVLKQLHLFGAMGGIRNTPARFWLECGHLEKPIRIFLDVDTKNQ